MNPDATVVFNTAELTKAIHEEADARAGGPDHFRQRFLGDFWDQAFWLAGSAKFRQQEKDSCQSLFAGVEELIDKIGLYSHAVGQQKFHK